MSEKKTFYCLRCEARFPLEYDPKQTVEKSCPKCGSNSVRLETPVAAASHLTVRPEAKGG